MKKTLFVLVLILFATQSALSQLTVNILTKNPMPSALSVWETDPTALRLVVVNTTQISYPGLRVSFTITNVETQKVIASSVDTDPSLPTFDIGPAQTVIRFGKDVVNGKAVTLDQSVKSVATATNRIPEGTYQLCVRILAAEQGGGVLGSQCQTFMILIPDPPSLISPLDEASVLPPAPPTFTWTPVFVSPGVQAQYKLTIAPIFKGQSTKDAIDKNTPLFQKPVLTTTYWYGPSNPPFSLYPTAAAWAWQVQAVDAAGTPVARNEGKSEVFKFTTGSAAQPPALVAPADQAVLKTKSPKFSWTYTFVPSENTRFRLRVAEIGDNQTPEVAINNYPVYTSLIYGQVTSHTPAKPLSLSATKHYVWQVQVLDAATAAVLRSSPVFRFTIDPLQLLLPSANQVVAFKRPTFQWSWQGSTGNFYDLRIAAIPMMLTPQFSLENLLKNGPYVHQMKNINGKATSGVNSSTLEIPQYTPNTNLSLNGGVHYAWQIIARSSPNGPVIGTSEIRTFTYNPYQTGIPYNTQVSGKLVYKFPGNDNNFWPFGGVNIKLVVKYVLKNVSASGGMAPKISKGGSYVVPPTSTIYFPGFDQNPPDMNKVLAVAKTGPQGNFTFSFISLDSMKLIQKNYKVSSGGGEFSGSVTGDLYRTSRILVESPTSSYFTSPDVDVTVQPGETVAPGFLGLVPSFVRGYSLDVHVTTVENIVQATTGSLANMNVYLLRQNPPAYVPKNEGAEPKRSPTDKVQTLKMYWGAVCEVIGKAQTGTDGIAHFTRLVKNIGPNDKYILYAESMPGNFYNYKGWLGDVQFHHSSDKAVYNNEYHYQKVTKTLQCYPLQPRVYGTVRRGDSKQPLLWSKVSLVETIFLATKTTKHWTNIKGEFDFPNLKVITKGKQVIGPIRLLKISRYGYRDTTLKVNNLVPMRPGEQVHADVELQPYSVIKGKIVDEFGNGVATSIRIVGGKSINVTPPPYFVAGTFKRVPTSFTLPAPQGWQTIITDPTFTNNTLLRDTLKVYVDKPELQLQKPIVLYRKAHRVRVTVAEATGSKLHLPGYVPKKIAGAVVEVQDKFGNPIQGPNGALHKVTNQSGVAEFVFANSGTEFFLSVKSPKDQDYIAGTVPVPTSFPSKDWIPVTAALKKGTHISGFVYVGNDQPVANAHVFIDPSSTSTPVETWSDSKGAFNLRSVPLGTYTYWAAKSQSNFIGAQQKLTTTTQALQGTIFRLKVYENMDISHLMGFPIEVDSLNDAGGSIRISGQFMNLDSLGNNIFQASSATQGLTFHDVEIVPGALKTMLFGKQVPVAKPKASSVKTEENEFPVSVYHSFPAVVQDQNIGVEVIESQTGHGAIKGRVFVGESAFQNDLSFDEKGFFVRGPASSDLRIPVITASQKDPVTAPNGLPVVSSSGGSVHFSMYEFNATADSSASFLVKDSVRLRTTLHTALDNVTPSDLAIDLGTVTAGKQGFSTMSNVLKKVTLHLDQWTVTADTFSINGYLQLKGGVLKTSAVDVPVLSMIISPNHIESADFDLKNMSIGGIIPLTVYSQPLLGYDAAYKRWFLSASGSPAASFSGLPGMAPGSKFKLATFSLYSTDAAMALTPMVSQPKIKIYDVGVLTPDQIAYFPSTGIVTIKGLSFAFPKVAANATISYTKENNQVKFHLVPFQFSFDSKGVHFAAGYTNADGATQTLDVKGFRARGTISEAGKFSFHAWVYHTKDSTSIWVENPSTPYVSSAPPWQTLAISGGATYLDKITGSMKPLGNQDWDYFSFAGDLAGSKAVGFTPGKNRLTFVVHGDVIADGQELGISNVATPFGNMTWTYDFAQSRLWGHLHVDKTVGGQIALLGDVNTVVDGSGWYFLGGMNMSMTSPHFAGQAAIMFGSYPMTEDIKDTFKDHSWVYQNKHELPSAFPSSVSGFFFEGSVEMPIPIFPDFDFNFGLVSAKLTKIMGADVRFGTDFGKVNTYSAGVDVFAKIEAGVGGTIGVACATVDAKILADLKFEGDYQSNGAWYLEGEQSITFTGTTKVGFGGCDANCESIDIGPLSTPCATNTEGASKSIGILCHYGSDGKYLHVYFK